MEIKTTKRYGFPYGVVEKDMVSDEEYKNMKRLFKKVLTFGNEIRFSLRGLDSNALYFLNDLANKKEN